ncbi:MAG: TAT-variant-translocated molybdopterin oxidoreductase [Verrucomicrobiia bacterium]|jgi:molybdopterin-containing oxidoreductase family iron-sulfur binding subunit
MNPPSANTPQPPTGPRYWRSLDELADTPAFRQWVEREFPEGATEWRDPVTRRHFVKIMSASFLLAGLGMTGCRRPEENIYPFSKMPEDYVHGVPQFFATAMPSRGGAQSLLVKSLDGRPIKIEGNPQHPFGMGGTDRFAQASILNLYDPDRAVRFVRQGNKATREVAMGFLAATAKELAASGGEGVCFLMKQSSSPSRARLQEMISSRYPKVRWFTYEPVDFSVARQAATEAHQTAGLSPFYRLDRAKVIVSLDSDFISGEDDGARLMRDFARGRRIEKPTDNLSRLYVVESLMTLTGANSDHRLRLASSQIGAVAARLAAEVLTQAAASEAGELVAALQSVSLPADVKPEWVKECAKDLLANRGACVVLAGHRQPLAVHLLAQAINRALGNEGRTVELFSVAEPKTGTVQELAKALNAGEVKTLVICGGNPVYNAPADLDWGATQRKAKTVVRLGYYEDETTAICDWHFPAAHYLESWGDARTSDGTVLSVQPLIAPLFGGLTELEFLARLTGLEPFNSYEIVRETLRQRVDAANFEERWKRFLHDGFLAGSAGWHVDAPFNWAKVAERVRVLDTAPKPSKNKLEVVFHRDYSLDDGRFNNNGWLQELPDPITKVTWENVILLSAKTARELGVYFENPERGRLHVPRAKIELDGRQIEGPVWIQPGQTDYTVGLALGYGRQKTGRVGQQSGFDAYRLRSSKSPHFAGGATLKAAGQQQLVAVTQDHWAMEGRPIVREANLESFREHPDFAHKMDLDAHEPHVGALYPHPNAQNPAMKGVHQWGMVVDQNACVGCAACVIACQSENNIPIVGKDQVARGREMHWIRLDRYFSVAPEDKDLAAPQVVNQPMFCQHCENAPCENVCPVNATVHDEEGLNLMVYNRCVGTRYCSNNCPYKVRRFNYFDFNRRPLDQLYRGPLAPGGMPDLVQMVKNPDVTVRMRGVMEKCTFCVQRIEQAKIAQKIKARDSGSVRVPDGTITPACAQACPAEALVFGDVSDPNSRVSRIKEQSRNYSVLGFLNVKPRTTYLARVRNPNPAMPDYAQQPLSLAEYSRRNGDPMAEDHAPDAKKGGH